MTIRHCIVAMDTDGNHVQYVDLLPCRSGTHRTYVNRHIYTNDLGVAMKICGESNYNLNYPGYYRNGKLYLHPNNQRNLTSVLIGGFEVVSETIDDS